MVARRPSVKDANPNPEEGEEVEEVEKVDGEAEEAKREGASEAARRVRSRVKESPVARGKVDLEDVDLSKKLVYNVL